MLYRLLLILVIVSLLSVACGNNSSSITTPAETPTPKHTPTPTPKPVCSTSDGDKIVDLLDEYVLEWDDAVDLASSTPRIQLGDRVADLQEIRRNVVRQDWPECGTEAQTLMVEYQDNTIDAFVSFMSSDDDHIVEAKFKEANQSFSDFIEELTRLRDEDDV